MYKTRNPISSFLLFLTVNTASSLFNTYISAEMSYNNDNDNSVPTRIFAVIRFETCPKNTPPLVNIISVHRSLATANAKAEFFWQQGEARERGRRDRRDKWFSASGEVNNEGHVKWRHVEVVEGSGLVGTTSTRATIFVIVDVKTFPSSTSNNISDTLPPVANIISVHASLATANKAAEDFWRKEALRFLSSEREDERGHFGAVGELALDGNGRPLKWCCVRVEAMKVDD
jgi:hypothetical protein